MDINKPIYLVLIGGVIVSSMLFGLAFSIYLLFPSFSQIAYVLAFAGAGVLILTPYVRVIVALITFFINKEYKFVAISSLVLLVMIVSFLTGIFFHIAPKG